MMSLDELKRENQAKKLEYKRPETLNLLTEEQLTELYEKDVEKQEKDNREHDYDYPDQMNRYLRKWYKKIYDAKEYWDSLYQLDENGLYEVIHWLSVKDEPKNPHNNGINKIKRISRAIKYAMTSKQREVSYKIIEERYNKFGKLKVIKAEE